MSQMKEKDKTKAEEANEMEISNMLDKFKVTVIKIQNLRIKWKNSVRHSTKSENIL